MRLRFDSKAERDLIVSMSPIIHEGVSVTFERSEEASGCFTIHQPWLVAIAAKGFPDEHWTPSGIPAASRKLGKVVEIDPVYMLEEDFSVLWVVVARTSATGVPDDLWVGNDELGPVSNALRSMFHIEVLRTWPCIEQVDALGRLRPFFPRPPSPRNSGFGSPGPLADPPLFGPVLPGAAVGYPNFGPGVCLSSPSTTTSTASPPISRFFAYLASASFTLAHLSALPAPPQLPPPLSSLSLGTRSPPPLHLLVPLSPPPLPPPCLGMRTPHPLHRPYFGFLPHLAGWCSPKASWPLP